MTLPPFLLVLHWGGPTKFLYLYLYWNLYSYDTAICICIHICVCMALPPFLLALHRGHLVQWLHSEPPSWMGVHRNCGEKGFVQNLVKEEKKEPNSQTSYQIYLTFSHILFILDLALWKGHWGQSMVTDKGYSSTLLSVWKQGVDIICIQKEELLLSCIRTPYWRIEHTERFPGLLQSRKLKTGRN